MIASNNNTPAHEDGVNHIVTQAQRVEAIRSALRNVAASGRGRLWKILELVPSVGERAKVVSGELTNATGLVTGSSTTNFTLVAWQFIRHSNSSAFQHFK